MEFGDIPVCIDGSSTGRERTELALRLAVRSRARVIGYYLAPNQDRRAREFLDLQEAPNIDDAEADFARQLTVNSLDGAWVVASASRRVEDIVKYSRCVDLVVVGLGVPDDPTSDPQAL